MTEHHDSKGSKNTPRPDHLGLAKYSRRLHKFVMRRFGNHEGVSDLVQEAYLRILQRDKDGELIQDPLSYLYKTLENTAVRFGTREKSIRLVIDPDQFDSALEDPRSAMPNQPDQVLSARQSLRQLLKGLRPPYRRIWFLDRIRGFSDTEIAQRVGLSVHTVRIYKTRARLYCHLAWKDQ